MNSMRRNSKKATYNFIWIPVMLITMGIIFIGAGFFGYPQLLQMGEDAKIFLLLFSIIGAIPLLIGLIFLFFQVRKRLRHKKLKEQELPRSYPVQSVEYVQNIRINNRSPFILECHLPQANGDVYILKSGYLKFDPQPYLTDNKVLIYQDSNNIKNYFIDVDGSLANQIYEL